jgi:hypothetical protein
MTIELYTPPADNPPDAEFPETLAGGHALILGNVRDHSLVVEYGDCSFGFSCQCGKTVAYDVRPNRLWTDPVALWMHHVPGGVRGIMPHCQCGKLLGRQLAGPPTPALLERIGRAWEQHTMSLAASRA